MLFVGEYQVNLTGGGRIVIPKRIREVLEKEKSFTLTKGFDQCLSGFKNKDWERSALELMGVSVLEMRKIEIKRHLFSSAAILEIDDQGRIVIPKNLLDYADLEEKKEAIFIGVGTYFEIWSKEKWEIYKKELEKNIRNYQEK